MGRDDLPLYLIRHAKAGSRSAWPGPDELRPLSEAGKRQAGALVDQLDGRTITRLFSSPALRCVETLEPLAAARGLPLERAGALVEGTPLNAVLPFFDESVSEGGVALCTHGDVLELLLDGLADLGVRLHDRRATAKKGSVWIIEQKRGAIVSGHYLPPAL